MQFPDLELARRAQKGEESAFHELVDRYANELFKLAFSLTGAVDGAEDVLQETFLGAFQGLDSFEGRSSVKTWLIRILVKQAAKYHRSRHIRKTESIDDILEVSSSAFSGRDSDLTIDIKTMIKTLSTEHREVIVLRELQGFSYEEMAEILGIPRGTVESRLFRARQELRKRFRDDLL
ncbi:MAG: sigma-70 family RNA polymerase sigma factor [Deltaproteobacteria bacterium]|nr:MAG: sigma-70 family RNA polymerase sigma factor [Deltaproteobacteria bacterium]